MAKEFSPEDFEPIYHQTLVVTIAIQENPECTLSILSPFLIDIHTKLSDLIFKASNPNSVLRRRCSDRHPEWLQIQYDLQNTLCEAQDLVDSLSKSDVLEIGDHGGSAPEKVEEELAVHAFNLGEFVDSLGLSKLARSDPALGEIEKILVDAARDERERLGKERVAEIPDVNRLGGLGRIMEMLRANGVDRRELQRLDTRIKQLIVWVLRNEEELTMVRDLEGFGDLGKRRIVEPQQEQVEHHNDHVEEMPKLVQALNLTDEKETNEEQGNKAEKSEKGDAELDDEYDTVSIDSFVLV
ncbi:hypothetical protein N431DRAFT_433113 [Stipitochalara longipes BDJ]|nr:hypothetical protein N431DRAFT_433113 [Stipitochalara longipes BDJ]